MGLRALGLFLLDVDLLDTFVFLHDLWSQLFLHVVLYYCHFYRLFRRVFGAGLLVDGFHQLNLLGQVDPDCLVGVSHL